MEEKEEFCGACVAGVAAIVGAGTASVTRKKYKNTIFWISVAITVLSIIICVYLLLDKNACKSCSQSA